MQEESSRLKKDKTSNVSSVSSGPPINLDVAKKPVNKSGGGPGWGLTVLLAFVAGVLGAALFMRFMPVGQKNAVEQSKQVTLQENSATIDLVKKVGPSVVSINTSTTVQSFFGAQEQEGAGTGVIVSSDGLILTNKHVVQGASTVTVTNTDGKQFQGKILAVDSTNDIAFVKVEATGLPAAELGDSENVEVGQKAIAIGNALGEYSNTVTTGVISGKQRPVQASDGQGNTETLTNLFQTDAAINPGNSGGPLLNIDGQVIGINTAVASGNNAQNIGFAIPINQVKGALESVQTRGVIVRPYIGVRYVMLTDSFAERNGLPVKQGALLRGDDQTIAVVAGSPGAKAGLREGDIITKINDKEVTRENPLQSVIVTYSPGDTVKVTYWREGKEQTVDVKLEEAPQATE
ncbi:trypsin-like peptidase domain-containing protein [bacterium]|nr:MAG: trypsin-like peptidase domain-containing protein [bacterium]